MPRYGMVIFVAILIPAGTLFGVARPAAGEGDGRIWAKGLTSHVQSGRLDRDTFANLAAEASPAVVNIFTTEEVRRRGLPLVPFSPLIPGLTHRADDRISLGTGIIIHDRGYIVTNRHVIGDAYKIQVELKGGATHPALPVEMVVPRLDLMLLKIDVDEPLPVLAFGDSEGLRVGDWVMAIGNSYGLGHTVTTGTISNLFRISAATPGSAEMHHLDIIQTDASINEGNSGGPLLNLDGHVIGITTASVPKGQNIGFAIAINTVKAQLPTLNQLSIRPALAHGAVFVLLTAEEAETTYGDRSLHGRLKITKIATGSPAAKSDLRTGDVVLGINDQKVMTFVELQTVLSQIEPGERMTWNVRRKKRTRTYTVVGDPLAQ